MFSFTYPNNNWYKFFEKKNLELVEILEKISEKKIELENQEVYPPCNSIFKAFDLCDINNIKVVIIGQDCYHGKGQANGLCFSVNNGMKIPPSLRNIYKELKSDLGFLI